MIHTVSMIQTVTVQWKGKQQQQQNTISALSLKEIWLQIKMDTSAWLWATLIYDLEQHDSDTLFIFGRTIPLKMHM